jgi:DNA (cytosine-5)-methyltransferase 1
VPNAGKKHGNMIPEFERCVKEASPAWFLMENVPDAPEPRVFGYFMQHLVINNRWFGEEQERTRRLSFGTHDGRKIYPEFATFESLDYSQAVTSSLRKVPVAIGGSGKPKKTLRADGKRPGPNCGSRAELGDMLRLQGLPEDFFGDDSPFTMTAKRKMVGNGVPMAMGRAMAIAVAAAVAEAGR